MALTKSVASVDACQEITQNTVLEGTTVDISGCYESALHIDFALSNATAHTGTKIRVQVSSNTSGDEDWTDLYEFVSITGTTNLEVITNNPLAVGGTSITVTSTTGYTAGSWIFLEDVSTFANSEWCYVTVVTTNTSLTIIDGVTRQHAQNSILNSVAANYVVPLPIWAARARVVYDNTYDADGATVAVRARISKVTAV
jgi:hypothetical protein